MSYGAALIAKNCTKFSKIENFILYDGFNFHINISVHTSADPLDND